MSVDMGDSSEFCADDEVLLERHSCSYIYELLLPYPFDPNQKNKWCARAKSTQEKLEFIGQKGVTETGFRPGKNPGAYDPA